MVLETFAEVFPSLVLWSFGWMLPASVLALVFVHLKRHGYLRPFADLFHAARRLSLVGWFCVAPLVVGLVGYASTKNDGGSTNDAPTHMSAPRRLLRSPAEGWLIPQTPVTPDEIAAGWRAPADGAAGIVAAPEGAVTNERGRLRGAYDDAFRPELVDWRFPYRDGVLTGVTVLARGEVRPDVGTLYFPVPRTNGVSLLPEARRGLLSRAPEAGAQPNRGEFPSDPGDVQIDGSALGCAPAPGARERASVFWHAQSPSNSLLLTWENALVGRDPNSPTNLQAELFADGRFAWRTDEASRLYLPVLDFDWDGDGLENSVDPDPLVAGPDAHGTNDEWYNVVCSNVFVRTDGPADSEPGRAGGADGAADLLPGGVVFRPEVNAGAYYFVDVVAGEGPAPVYFNADRDSRLGSPVVVARAGGTNRVPLLVGVEYSVTSTVPFAVSVPVDGHAAVTTNGVADYTVRWPLAFRFVEDAGAPGAFSVEAVPYDPGVTFTWRNAPSGGASLLAAAPAPASSCACWSGSGSLVVFDCSDSCSCGGGCRAVGTAGLENASFAVTGGVCHCSSPDGPPEDPPPPDPDPLVGGLSVRFSQDAVVFEDAYRDTDDGPLVPRRSTTTRLTVSASGGTFGGTFTLSARNLEKLSLAGGSGPPALPSTMSLAPFETYSATFTCEGVEASGSEDDVEVSGVFVGGDVAGVESPSDSTTVVQVELEAVYAAPGNSSRSRHVYGVGEDVCFKVTPALSAVTIRAASRNRVEEIVTHYNSFAGDGEVDGAAPRVYTCPVVSTWGPDVAVSYRGVEYRPSMETVEPQLVVTPRAEWDGGCFPTYTVGEAGLYTYNYIGPMHVSFQGIAVSEIPCNENDVVPPTGFFTNCVSGPFHGTAQGAGVAHWIKEGNYWMKDDAYTTQPAGTNWSTGTLVWKIPIGWHRKDPLYNGNQNVGSPDYQVYKDASSRPLLIGGRRDAYLQTREILEDGTFRSEKFGHWITRGTWCRIILDGSTMQWFKFH